MKTIKQSTIVILISLLILVGQIDRVEAKTQVDSGAVYVIAAYRQLVTNFYNPKLLNRVKLLNAALDGMKKGLNQYGIEFEPRYISEDNYATQVHFISEFERAASLCRDAKIEDHLLEFAATDAMLKSLKDSHTFFINPETYQEIVSTESGQTSFAGIGSLIDQYKGGFYLYHVLMTGSAYQAGLRDFDVIVKINDESVINLNMEQVINKLRGPANSTIQLTIKRQGKLMDFVITREPVILHPVEHSFRTHNNRKILHVRILGFFDFHGAFNEYLRGLALSSNKDRKISGIIVDLRHNRGGYLHLLDRLVDMCLGKDHFVYTLKANKIEELHSTVGDEPRFKHPMVVLINDGSASASEIFAAAMQEAKRATIIGTRSTGAVSVARRFIMPYGSCLSITVAQFFTANGKVLEGNGVEPDIKVDLADEDIESGHDAQLERAVEVLTR